MLAIRDDLIGAGPEIASDSRCIKLGGKLDAPGAVAQPERVVAIKLIPASLPAHYGGRRTYC